jgi:very-short-patch-repair endonuclease
MTVDRDRGGARRDGVDLTRRDLDASELEDRDGLRLTSALRTAVDCARDLPLVEGVAAVDSALRSREVTLAQLREALVALPAGRGRAAVARVLALVDPDAGSVLESVCRIVLHLAGLAPERTQLVITRGRARIGRVDFAWPSALLVVEVDGFEFHSDRASYRRDRRRTTALARAGWTVLRFSWEDVTLSPDWVVDSVREALGPCRRCAV